MNYMSPDEMGPLGDPELKNTELDADETGERPVTSDLKGEKLKLFPPTYPQFDHLPPKERKEAIKEFKKEAKKKRKKEQANKYAKFRKDQKKGLLARDFEAAIVPVDMISDFVPDFTLTKLHPELAEAATSFDQRTMRSVVDSFYQFQDYRIRCENRLRAAAEGLDSSSPGLAALEYMVQMAKYQEEQVKGLIKVWANNHPVAIWLQTIHGIGPILAAGFVAHINMDRVECTGDVWKFAGVIPGMEWVKGKPRPWNAKLKMLLYKIGESFVKLTNKEDAYYARLYKERKVLETERNDSGKYADQAVGYAKEARENILKRKGNPDDYDFLKWLDGCFPAGSSAIYQSLEASVPVRKKWMDENDLGKGNGQRMLPPSQIHGRARRFAVKIFVDHALEYWWNLERPQLPYPMPYAIAHLGHAHLLRCPYNPESGKNRGAVVYPENWVDRR